MEIQPIVDLVLEELVRSEKIYPNWPDDKIHQASIVAKEAGELIKAANDFQNQTHTSKDRMIEEAKQVGAMAIRFLKNIAEEY